MVTPAFIRFGRLTVSTVQSPDGGQSSTWITVTKEKAAKGKSHPEACTADPYVDVVSADRHTVGRSEIAYQLSASKRLTRQRLKKGARDILEGHDLIWPEQGAASERTHFLRGRPVGEIIQALRQKALQLLGHPDALVARERVDNGNTTNVYVYLPGFEPLDRFGKPRSGRPLNQ